MEQFIITHIDGSTISLRQRSTVINVTRATQSVELLGNDVVDISVESAVKLYFQIGDKITIVGRDYTLNIPPKETKLSENKFRYDLQFEGVQYDLSRATYDVNIDTTGSDLYADALTGNMKLFLDVLIANINRVFPGKWVLGTYPDDTETKTLTFSETDNCLAVLQRLCEEYNQEFDIAIAQNGTRTINIEQAGKTIAFTFQYGKGKGIYELTREKVSSSNIVNRLKVYGGSKNISSKYRATRLCLPGKSKSQSYIENAESIAKYGIWENAIYFEDIFPQRTGVITALGDTILKFIDNTMDFDLNEKEADGKTTKYLLAGTPAKVHFNTGNLAGYEFEITSYDHVTKTFTIKSFSDERDMKFPSETSAAFRFAVGDEYVLLDIAMPQSYIDAAEQKLLEKGQEYLSQNCQPKVQYSLKLVEFFLKKTFGTDVETNIFWVGDYIPIKDDDLEVDKLIRVKGFTRDLLKECSYNLTISDLAVTRSIYNRIISDLIDIDKIIQINDLANVAKARRNWLNAQEVLGMVFDVEGDYYTDKIKPQSIETMMLSVGAKSMQFVLVGTVFQPNYGGNKNRIVYKGGTLTHYAIVDENNNPRYWVLQDGDVTVTNDFQAYYIYAKCEKNGTGGIILFSDQQIQAEQDTNYYHFLIGVLNSVDSALQVRSISLMYGFTTINGKFIRTGRIDSIDGKTYFDLDNSVIGGKIRFVSTGGDEQDMGEWVETTEEALSIITSDNYLSASEKPSQRKEWETVYSERNGLISQATNFGITTEKDNYSNAFQALSTYLNGGTTWTSGVPLWINDASLSVDTAIIGTTYRQKWVDLYSAKAALTNAIQIKIDQLSTDKVNGIQMGDRNLLRNSNPNVTNNLYPTVALSLSDEGKKLIEGEQVTIIIKGELGAGKTNFGIFNSNDYVRMVDISPSSFVNGIATKTFNWKIYHPTYPASNTSVKIFAMPSSSANSTVEWVKLVRGNKVTTDWTSAPEDIEAEIEDVSTSVTNLNTYVDGAFKDGVIDASEAKAIEKYINIVNTEKAGLEANYNKLYVNTYLTGTPKTDLLNSKVTYFGSLDTLINSINTAIADGKTTSAEKATVDSKYASYKTALADFRTKIEAANQAIQNTLKSYSDEAKAKAEEADYLKQALKQDTDISGGLLLSSILATRDAGGVVRSYQSGDPDANPAAFAAGVENFGTTSEKKKVEICHDGTGRIGIFVIDDLGNIKIYDPLDPTILRLMFSKNALPTLQSILDENIYGGSVTNIGALGTESNTILPNKITVTQSGSDVHFTGNLTISGFLAPGYSSGKIQVTVMIVNEASLDAIYSITDGRVLDPIYNPSYYNETSIDKTIHNVEAGTYRVEIHRVAINMDNFIAGLSGRSTLSWSFIKDIRRFEFARNGFMAFYQNNHMYFSETGGLDVRGAMNIPGVLLAGEVGYTGGFTSSWGAKKHVSSTAVKITTGQYRVYHSIGHTDYQIQITPTTANRTAYIYSKANDNFVVYFYSVGSSPSLSDTGFHFSITGRNY